MFTRPVSGVPAARSSNAMVKIKVFAILGAGALSALFGLLGFLAWVFFSPEIPDPESFRPRSAAQAEIVARDFLAGRPTAIPVAEGLDPAFLAYAARIDERGPIRHQGLTLVTTERDSVTINERTTNFEKHTFLTASGDRLIEVHVTMLLGDDGPVLAAHPSLLLPELPQAALSPLDYSNAANDVGREVPAVVRRWSRAFLADDASELRTIAGDQTTEGRYVGLGGFSLHEDREASLLTAVTVGEERDAQLVRVRMLLAENRDNGGVVGVEYDLLVNDAFTSLPKVVAWAPAGTPTLQPFTNLVED